MEATNRNEPAKDKFGNEIKVGDTLLCPIAGGVSGAKIIFGTVTKIAEPSHRGYGWWTRKLTVLNSETGKKITHNYPCNCVKIDSAGAAGLGFADNK